MNRFRFLAALVCVPLLASCSKDSIQAIDAPVSGAYVKFFNFGVNAPAVNYYGNDVKLTAVSSTNCQTVPINPLCNTTGLESTSGTAYGAAGNAGLYSAVAPGTYTLAGKSVVVADNGAAVTKVTTPLDAGKYYSLYTSGFYDANAKTVESFVLRDSLPAMDYTQAYVRFVDAIPNSSPMILYAKNTTTAVEVPIGVAVAYKGGSAFVALPAGGYDLSTRAAGSATNLVTRAAVGFSAGVVYTITARGDITASAGTNKPALDNTANR